MKKEYLSTWNGSSVRWSLKLFMFLHLDPLLELVVVYDILVCGAALGESVQVVHVLHVAPQVAVLGGHAERVDKERA